VRSGTAALSLSGSESESIAALSRMTTMVVPPRRVFDLNDGVVRQLLDRGVRVGLDGVRVQDRAERQVLERIEGAPGVERTEAAVGVPLRLRDCSQALRLAPSRRLFALRRQKTSMNGDWKNRTSPLSSWIGSMTMAS